MLKKVLSAMSIITGVALSTLGVVSIVKSDDNKNRTTTTPEKEFEALVTEDDAE